MKVTFKTGSEVNYGSTNGELFFASNTKQIMLNGIKYIPKKLSELTNDSGFITSITKSMVEGVLTGNITSHTHSYLPLSGGTLTGTLNMPGQQINAGSITVSDSISAGSISANSISCGGKDVSLSGHTHTFASLESKPTTLSGYGITDAAKASALNNYLPLAGGTMTGSIYINNTVPITHKTAESRNWIYISKLLTGRNVSNKSYEACIGWLNQGGDGGGALTLIPYAQDDAPWTGRIGLYIAQNSLKFNNTAVSLDGHTHSYLPLTGGTLTGNLTCNGSYITMSGSSGAKGYSGYFNNPKRSDRASYSHILGDGYAYGTYAISIGSAAYAGIRNTDSDSGTYPYLHWQWMDCLKVKEVTSAGEVNCYGAILNNLGGTKDTAKFKVCVDGVCIAYDESKGEDDPTNQFLKFTNTDANYGRVVVFIANTDTLIFGGTTEHPRRMCNLKIGNVILGQGCRIADVASMTINGKTVYRLAIYWWSGTLSASYDITKTTTAMVCTKVNNSNYSGASSYASGYYSVSSGYNSVASGYYSVSSGYNSVASGYYSVSSGYNSVASGYNSVASGAHSVASGAYSVASGDYSVASGAYSVASGYSSVAIGHKSKALKLYDFVSGYRCSSNDYFQTVIGRTNAPVKGAFVIGNGSIDNVSDDNAVQSNCFVVDWNGNVNATGTLTATTFNGSLNGTATKAAEAGMVENSLSITLGTSAVQSYNGSAAVSLSITPSKIGAAEASHTHTFASLTSKPTTLSGYGITDVYTKTETNTELGKYLPLTGGTLNGALTVPKLTSTGGILLGDSSLSAMVGSVGIQRYDETGFIGFLKDFNLDNSFNGVVLGWDGNYSLQENSVRINASTFTYKGNSVLHSGNLGYISSGLSRAVQKDTNGNLFIVAPSLFEQGISNNYPKNLRWSNETEGQLVYDTEIEADNFDTVEIGIPLADGTSKGFLKSTSTVTNVTGYTPCPVVSGTPYYKEDCLYLGSTEIGYTGIMEYGIQHTFNYGTKLPYLEDYTPDSIPRCVVLCFPDRSSNYRFLFWLSAFDEGDPYIARFYNSAYETWLTIDTASRQIILSYGNTWQS